MNKLIALTLILILSNASITGAIPVDVGYFENTYPALDYTGAWSVLGDDNAKLDVNPGSGVFRVGNLFGTTLSVAQQFVVPTNGIISEFRFTLSTNLNNPVGDLNWAIHTDNANTPGDVLLSGTHTPVINTENVVPILSSQLFFTSEKHWIVISALPQAYHNAYNIRRGSSAYSQLTATRENADAWVVTSGSSLEFEVTVTNPDSDSVHQTTDYTASVSFDVFSDGLTVFFRSDPSGDDLSVCVDLVCQTASTTGAAGIGRVTITNMADGLKTITLSKNTDDNSVIKIDAIYVHPYESASAFEFSRDEVELITFEYDSETYNAALDYTISAGDAILAIMLSVLILIQLFTFVKSAWEVEV